VKSSDQGVFSSIKNFDPGRKWFYRSIGSDYPLSIHRHYSESVRALVVCTGTCSDMHVTCVYVLCITIDKVEYLWYHGVFFFFPGLDGQPLATTTVSVLPPPALEYRCAGQLKKGL